MKNLVRTRLAVVIAALQFVFADPLPGYLFDGNTVRFTKDEAGDIDLLSDKLTKHHQELVKVLPESVRKEMTGEKDDMLELSRNSMDWVSRNVISSTDEALSSAIRSVVRWSVSTPRSSRCLRWLACTWERGGRNVRENEHHARTNGIG